MLWITLQMRLLSLVFQIISKTSSMNQIHAALFIILKVCSIAGNDVILCQKNTCRNGECYVTDNGFLCDCGKYFYGSLCERIGLQQASATTESSKVTFQWPAKVKVTGYSFAYKGQDDLETFWSTTVADIQVVGSYRLATLSGVQQNRTYIICLKETKYIQKFVSSWRTYSNMAAERDCATLKTAPSTVVISGLVQQRLLYIKQQLPSNKHQLPSSLARRTVNESEVPSNGSSSEPLTSIPEYAHWLATATLTYILLVVVILTILNFVYGPKLRQRKMEALRGERMSL